MTSLGVILIDDHPLLREGLKRLLELDGRIKVVEEAATAEEGLRKVLARPCDTVLADISLPDRSGLWLVGQLREHRPALPVLVLSMHTDERTVVQAVEAGASGYLPKSASYREIRQAVLEVTAGGIYLHPRVAVSVVNQLRSRRVEAGAVAAPPSLTGRERQILVLAAQGLTCQSIARQLSLSSSTVKTHLRGLYRKLEVGDRTQAVLAGIQMGVITAAAPLTALA